jgi:hypothetical protein
MRWERSTHGRYGKTILVGKSEDKRVVGIPRRVFIFIPGFTFSFA